MLYLFTGSPGSGKTLSAMDFIRQVKQETPDRIIYAANVEGINIPGVIQLDDAGVLAWHEACEKNSLVVVDEAQRYWRAQRSGEPSQAIIEMETHRHDGIDIVMMTQHPTFLHANIRKLMNYHTHLVSYTKKSALRWEWRECHDDVQDKQLRESGEFKEWFYPPELFDWYTSATQHTKRVKRPLKQILARAFLWVFGLSFVVGAVWFGWYASHQHSFKDLQDTSYIGKTSVSAGVPLQGGSARLQYTSTKDYVVSQLPRVPSQPYSAPIYDGQSPTQHPRIWCIAPELPDPCRCITEQGTRYALDQALCRTMAMDGGAYDPFLPASRNEAPARSAAPPVAMPPAPVASILPVSSGKERATATAYIPPTMAPWNSDPFGGK